MLLLRDAFVFGLKKIVSLFCGGYEYFCVLIFYCHSFFFVRESGTQFAFRAKKTFSESSS